MSEDMPAAFQSCLAAAVHGPERFLGRICSYGACLYLLAGLSRRRSKAIQLLVTVVTTSIVLWRTRVRKLHPGPTRTLTDAPSPPASISANAPAPPAGNFTNAPAPPAGISPTLPHLLQEFRPTLPHLLQEFRRRCPQGSGRKFARSDPRRETSSPDAATRPAGGDSPNSSPPYLPGAVTHKTRHTCGSDHVTDPPDLRERASCTDPPYLRERSRTDPPYLRERSRTNPPYAAGASLGGAALSRAAVRRRPAGSRRRRPPPELLRRVRGPAWR